MDWHIQGIRFVLFSPPTFAMPDAQDLWEKILAPRRPENINRPKGPGLPQSIASGSVRNNQIAIAVQPGRLDLTVNAERDPWSRSQDDAELDSLLKPALVYGSKCLATCESIRVALVTDAVKPCVSIEDAYSKFLIELPFIPHRTDVRDVNFQINPPTLFRVSEGKRMFRLCRWSTGLIQIFNVPFIGANVGSFPPGQPPPLEQRHILSFQADLSGEPLGNAPLDSSVSTAMLDEIGQETRKLLLQGYEGLLT